MKPRLDVSIYILAIIQFYEVNAECTDVSFSSTSVQLESLKKISRVAVSGRIAAFHLETAVSDQQYSTASQPNGNPLVIYSTLSHVPSWSHVDLLAQSLRIRNAFGQSTDSDDVIEDTRQPLLMLTVCDYETPITAFDDSSYTVDTQRAGLVSMYENELLIVFRSFRSGVFFFSMADQGDVLVAQVVHGTVHVIFDFGSLSPSRISGGRALDDGKWHELRWLHQFDSVQLSVDGVLLNHTTPTGLYRKLDLHNQVYVGGRPPDDFSEGIESTFVGCLARLQLNSADLLHFAPREGAHVCKMPSPPSLTLAPGAVAVLPFSFLPFSFEFRVLSASSSLLDLMDADNSSLLLAAIEEDGSLSLASNATKYRQKANPVVTVSDGAWHSFSLRIRGARLEVDIDGRTVLWLEGQEVRRVSVRLASLALSSPGCFRSATIDFANVRTEGNATRGQCHMVDRCMPSPCENGGTCTQTTLDDYKCVCQTGYKGKNCHTSDLPRSCEEWLYQRGGSRSKVSKGKNVTIDLDGGGPLAAFQVVCKTEKDELGVDVVTTILEHDLRLPMIVTGDNAPGAVRKHLGYGIATEQMDRLVEGFDSCTQFMRFVCRGGARLMTHGQDRSPSSWYATRSDKHGLQWGEAPPYSRMCSCAVNGTCTHNRMCNCDSGEDGVDEGVNGYAQLLPVTGLFLGGTNKASSVEVEIGPLMCRNRISWSSVTFSDRNARLTGSRSFSSATFDFAIQLRLGHAHMAVLTWESADSLHWFHLYIQEGKLVGELVNGGETVQIHSDIPINDNKWHTVYWEADRYGMRLRVDGRTKEQLRDFIMPSGFHWTIGSRTERGNSGFAGVIRNVYLCGEELMLSTAAKRDTDRGITVGETGYCRPGLCKNDGLCMDRFDGYSCDCSMTPFGGNDCTKEYGMWVAAGSSLQIPWQNPAHTSLCHRISIRSSSMNVSLVRSKALFADATFNMTIDEDGHLSVSIYDGFFFHHREIDKKRNLSDDAMHDLAFCADSKQFNLTIDGEKSITFIGNWTFFQAFNVWTFLDANYTGCVSRLQVGSSFPLKNPKAARLKHSGKIKFGACPIDAVEATHPPSPTSSSSGIHINAVTNTKQHIISFTAITGLSVGATLLVVLAVLVCYMKSRPEGVYKTNEGNDQCSPSSFRSEEPLVRGQPTANSGKEYFC